MIIDNDNSNNTKKYYCIHPHATKILIYFFIDIQKNRDCMNLNILFIKKYSLDTGRTMMWNKNLNFNGSCIPYNKILLNYMWYFINYSIIIIIIIILLVVLN